MGFRALALPAALLMGMPGLNAPGWGKDTWVEICDSAHPGRRILLSTGPDQDGSPPGGCHAACGIVSERRQTPRR